MFASEQLFDLLLDLSDLEWLTLDLVQTDRFDQELAAYQKAQLARVQFWYEYLFVAFEHVLDVLREGAEVAEMRCGDRAATLLNTLHSRSNRSRGAPPTEYKNLALARTEHRQRWDIVGDPLYLFRADAHHVLMVDGVITDVSRNVLLLEAADAMLEAGRSGYCPRSCQRLRVALVGLVIVAGFGERDINIGQLVC